MVEDGKLRKLLGVRYEWKDIDDQVNARVVLNMEDKALETIRVYEKATDITPRVQKIPEKPCEILKRILVTSSSMKNIDPFQES